MNPVNGLEPWGQTELKQIMVEDKIFWKANYST